MQLKSNLKEVSELEQNKDSIGCYENKKLSNVAVITNFNISDKLRSSLQVIEKLMELGCKITVPARGEEKIKEASPELAGKIEFLTFDRFYKNLDAVVVLGGDGSILESARFAASYSVPVLGMNLGRLGYLAELEMNELQMLSDIVGGNYTIDERSMLKVGIRSQKKGRIHCGYALNDAILSNGSAPKVIDLQLYESDSLIASYRADGIIVATPTGSTAYSMSAGGAVVDPRLDCFCVTPICPHTLASKPLLFPDSTELEFVNTWRREKMICLTLDGRQTYDVYFGDSVIVTKATMTAKFIRIKPRSFYQTLRSKMSATEG